MSFGLLVTNCVIYLTNGHAHIYSHGIFGIFGISGIDMP